MSEPVKLTCPANVDPELFLTIHRLILSGPQGYLNSCRYRDALEKEFGFNLADKARSLASQATRQP